MDQHTCFEIYHYSGPLQPITYAHAIYFPQKLIHKICSGPSLFINPIFRDFISIYQKYQNTINLHLAAFYMQLIALPFDEPAILYTMLTLMELELNGQILLLVYATTTVPKILLNSSNANHPTSTGFHIPPGASMLPCVIHIIDSSLA